MAMGSWRSLTREFPCSIHRKMPTANAPIGKDRMKIVFASDSSVLVEFGDSITAEIQDSVLGLFHALREIDDSRIRNLHPGYVSLLVDFDPLRLSHQEVMALIESHAGNRATAASDDFATITIPVCYDAEFGPDLAD